MSLLSSLVISTNGLAAQSSALSNISSNLANSSTTAYKDTDTSFADLVTSDSSSGSSGTAGVTASVDYDNDAQGTISSTSSSTDLAIDGAGYFAVCTATTNADGTLNFSSAVYYTRCGDFSQDANGYLVNSEGYYLMGWAVDSSTGDVNSDTLVPIQISSAETNAAVATSTLSYAANLPAGTDTTASSTVTVYDSLGDSHDVTYSWSLTDSATNTWTLTITAADGLYDSASDTTSDYSATIVVSFDSSENVETVDYGDWYDVTDTTISFELSYEGADAQTISCDLSDVTQYAGSSIEVSSFSADGTSSGSYSSMSIDSSGNVSVTYTNGQSETYYEIPIATFSGSNYLQLLTGNAYAVTASSGEATYSTAGTNGTGTVSSSSLEDSTVDIATEFTNLVETQQVYAANAKIVSAVSEMMKTLVELQ